MPQRDYDYDELFPGRFLKAVEFQGREFTLVITAVELEEMPDKRGNKVNKDGERVKVKPLVSFAKPNGQPVEKQLVLNRTNAECLKGMFGRKVGRWVGKRVTLYPVTVEAFGEEKPAIRVRGSPDIERDTEVELQLGQKTRKATMKRTAAAKTNGAPAATPKEAAKATTLAEAAGEDVPPDEVLEAQREEFEAGFGSGGTVQGRLVP